MKALDYPINGGTEEELQDSYILTHKESGTTKLPVQSLMSSQETTDPSIWSTIQTQGEKIQEVSGAVDDLSKMHEVFYNPWNGIPKLGISTTSTLKELCEAMVSYKNANGIRYLQTLTWINSYSTIGTDVQEALGTNATFGILEASCMNNDVYLTYRTYIGDDPAPLVLCVYTKTNNINNFSSWKLIDQVTIDSAISELNTKLTQTGKGRLTQKIWTETYSEEIARSGNTVNIGLAGTTDTPINVVPYSTVLATLPEGFRPLIAVPVLFRFAPTKQGDIILSGGYINANGTITYAGGSFAVDMGYFNIIGSFGI